MDIRSSADVSMWRMTSDTRAMSRNVGELRDGATSVSVASTAAESRSAISSNTPASPSSRALSASAKSGASCGNGGSRGASKRALRTPGRAAATASRKRSVT